MPCCRVELVGALGVAALLYAPRHVHREILLQDVVILPPRLAERLASYAIKHLRGNEGEPPEPFNNVLCVGVAELANQVIAVEHAAASNSSGHSCYRQRGRPSLMRAWTVD